MLLLLGSFSVVGQTRYDYYNTDVKKKDGVMRVSKDGGLLTGIVFGTYKMGSLSSRRTMLTGFRKVLRKLGIRMGNSCLKKIIKTES